MSNRRLPRRPVLVHAARVAAVATLLLGLVYVAVVVVFDVVDAHHLVAQVDANLNERLAEESHHANIRPARGEEDDDHDVDSAPVVLWRVDAAGHSVVLTDGAPTLPNVSLGLPTTVTIGSNLFRLSAVRAGAGWLVAGQSLAEQSHVEHVLLAGEILVGPILLLATYLGTLVIGLKASGPVELARRRQLEFTAEASHELRTPLSVIEAEVDLALSAPRDAARYRDTLGRVGRESDRLRRIVEDLLWLARFDSEPPLPNDEPVDLAPIAEGCADRFHAVARSQDIMILVSREGDAQAFISAPSEWIDRLLGVLVDNACRYAGPGGTVRIVVTAQGHKVGLAVEDNGPGIPVDERGRLFDRFHRATDQGTGAGLGLAIADSVVHSTGGQWHVGDASAGGARMAVTWHVAQSRGHGPPHVMTPLAHDTIRTETKVPHKDPFAIG